MAWETLTCPYCNAAIHPAAGLSSGQRIVCPRCGDAFALRPGDAVTDQPQPPGETAFSANVGEAFQPDSSRQSGKPHLRSPRSKWLVAAVVVGVMLLMAGGGLAFMLFTVEQRRAYDTSRPPRRPGRQPGVPLPASAPVVHVSPDKLEALGYLPPRVNFLLAARVPELLASPIGTRLLRDPIALGNAEYRLDQLPSWAGLRLEEIDHFVFAAQLDDALLPPFYLVLRTAAPYDAESMRQRMGGIRVAATGGKKMCSFRAGGKDITLHAWFADERTMVIALFPDQLKALPDQPARDLRQLPAELRTVLQERREPVAPVWIAGHSRDWSKTSAVKFLGRTKKEEMQRLAALRTFGVWFIPEETLHVRAVFACADATSASALEDYFRNLSRGDAKFKSAVDGPWLTVQYRTGADFLSRSMKKN